MADQTTLMRPNVFIGSSSEALPIAEKIQAVLAPDFDPSLWKDDLFTPGESTLEGLIRFIHSFDFAVLVLTADDFTKSRKKVMGSPRDNVIFELGLFMGALGRSRSFVVIVKTDKGMPKVPTDLLGNTALILDHPTPKGAKLKKALNGLLSALKERAKQSYLHLLPSTALAIGYYNNFLLPVFRALGSMKMVKVGSNAVEISKGNFGLVVVLPKTLSDASREGAARFAKTRGITDFKIVSENRDYPFYVHPKLEKKKVVFYDYPTTLNASNAAIRLALAAPRLGKTKTHLALEQKEIDNFERTVVTLLGEPEAAAFRDQVRFEVHP